jgi:hypothetical protein
MVISSLIILIFFNACRKENTPAAGDKVLQRVVGRSGDTIGYSSYEYDAAMRLVTIIDSNNNDRSIGTTSIVYDTTGDPIKFTRYVRYTNRPASLTTTLLIYQNGKVVEKLLSNFNNSSYINANTYTYDMKGRLIKDSAGSYGYTNFVYDDNDNIVQIKEFNASSGSMANTYTITSSYDGNVNPYKGIGLTLYFITNSYSLLSRHNRTREIYNQYNLTQTADYTYEYENGMPKKMTLMWDGGGAFEVNTVDFYYD